jgi:hypothetical protein
VTDLQQALAGAMRPEAPAQRARVAFIAGNVGRLGEELLNALLESPRYERVAVAVRKPMRSHVAKLEPVVVPAAREGWNPARAMARAPEDLFLCIEPERQSFWKLARPYVAVSSEWAAELARAMHGAGSRRVAVVTPLEAILQLGMVPSIRDTDELAILQAGFERMLVLRPTEEGRGEAPRGFFAAVGDLVMRTLAGYMTPGRLQPVRVRRVAQVAIETLATMADGVQVMGAARLRELVGDPLGG